MELTIIAVAAVVAIVTVAAVSQRIAVAAPLSMVVVGIALSFLPGLPKIEVRQPAGLRSRYSQPGRRQRAGGLDGEHDGGAGVRGLVTHGSLIPAACALTFVHPPV